ncbi:pyridoxal-phosphate dependent enzyme, partial [Myxococcota bacterium]|nr:pyridoxal-phosphate dependent enzyme [Myxococcota bacterium]
IAGQGTLISEILDARPDIATLVVAVGGGGLAAGAILAARGRRIIGVEPLGAPTLYEALAVGAPVRVEVESVAADALGAGEVGALPLALCAGKIHRVELIHDSAIIEAQRWLWAHLRLLVEPGAAITLAALAEGRFDADPGPIALVLGGANVDPCFLDL